MQVGDLVRRKRVHVDDDIHTVGLIVAREGDATGWDTYYKVMWGSSTSWEDAPNLEVVNESR